MASIEINKDCLNSWTQLADDKDDTNWFLNLWLYILNVLLSRVLWNYIDGRTPTVKFHSMGNGGLAELREQLNPTDLFYGGFLVKAVDQKQVIRSFISFITYHCQGLMSVRNRYIGFVFAGKEAPVLKRAKLTGNKAAVFMKMPNVSVTMEIIASDPSTSLSNTSSSLWKHWLF